MHAGGANLSLLEEFGTVHNAKQVPMQLQFFTKTESGHRINDVVPRALLVGTEHTQPWLLRG